MAHGIFDWDVLYARGLPEGFLAALYAFNSWSFLHHMGLIFVVLAIYMVIVTRLHPLEQPKEMPVSSIDVTPHPRQYILGGAVIVATIVLYIVFW